MHRGMYAKLEMHTTKRVMVVLIKTAAAGITMRLTLPCPCDALS